MYEVFPFNDWCAKGVPKLDEIFQLIMNGQWHAQVKEQEFVYFLRFARVITSFSCTRFLRKLAPTLHTRIYWVQANIMSIGKSSARVQSPVTTLVKQRK